MHPYTLIYGSFGLYKLIEELELLHTSYVSNYKVSEIHITKNVLVKNNVNKYFELLSSFC